MIGRRVDVMIKPGLFLDTAETFPRFVLLDLFEGCFLIGLLFLGICKFKDEVDNTFIQLVPYI